MPTAAASTTETAAKPSARRPPMFILNLRPILGNFILPTPIPELNAHGRAIIGVIAPTGFSYSAGMVKK
jgi:hypothetical protein